MNQPSYNTAISADGKCQTQPPSELETLNLVIDGTNMLGGRESPTLLGTLTEHLPKSIHYSLTAFEPQQDGTCVARYARVNADEN